MCKDFQFLLWRTHNTYSESHNERYGYGIRSLTLTSLILPSFERNVLRGSYNTLLLGLIILTLFLFNLLRAESFHRERSEKSLKLYNI